MNISYSNLLEKAVNDSLSLGLLTPEDVPSLCLTKIPEGDIFPLLKIFSEHLYSIGFSSSKSLNGSCILVHDQLQQFLHRHKIAAHMTIGSMHGQGWDYCAVPLDVLLNEMVNPDVHKEIKIHTWLTLDDASILDWTGQAWYDVQVKEDHPTERCLVYFSQGRQDDTHYYMPKFVGREFLLRTRSIDRVLKSR